MSSASSRPRSASRAASTAAGAVISTTRTVNFAAASAITARETLATTVMPRARSSVIAVAMP